MILFKSATVALISILALIGCAGTGNQKLKAESETSVGQKLIEGKTTKQEVRALYGSPLRTTFTDSGLELWTYEFMNVSADAVSFVPVLGSLGSSASGTKKQLVVLFDKTGTIQRFSMSESEVKHTSGIFN